MAVNYRPEIMVAALKEYEKEYGVNITFSVETEPLGTAGPLALAREILGKDDSPFFVLNSDVICDYPFEQIRDFHQSHGNEGTIIVSNLLEIQFIHPTKHVVHLSRLLKSTIPPSTVLSSTTLIQQRLRDSLKSPNNSSATRLMLVSIFSTLLFWNVLR